MSEPGQLASSHLDRTGGWCNQLGELDLHSGSMLQGNTYLFKYQNSDLEEAHKQNLMEGTTGEISALLITRHSLMHGHYLNLVCVSA